MRVIDILIAVIFTCMLYWLSGYYSNQEEISVTDGITAIEVGPDEEFIVRLTGDGKYMMIVSTRAETFFLYGLLEPWNIKTARLFNTKEGLCSK